MANKAGARILLVDDEELNREYLGELLEDEGYQVDTADDGLAALELLRKGGHELLITDFNMPRMDGLELLAAIEKEKISITSVLITAYGSIETAVQALKLGASDFIEKPAQGGMGPRLLLAVEQALRHHKLVSRNRSLEVALTPALEELIGESSQMEALRGKCRKLGQSTKTVLIRGETGTGKELVARGIHRHGPRRDKPFVAINCAAINRELLTSELFGHVKGAFSGAINDRPGKFEAAHTGSLFLDEIGEMDLELQAKMLRVLESREFEKVGSNETIQVDVRIIAATNRVLEKEVAEGRFREDLFHRLNVINVQTYPLREIPADIGVLANHFLSGDPEAEGLRFSEAALRKLVGYAWPGNTRELKHVVEQAVFYAEGNRIEAGDITLPVSAGTPDSSSVTASGSLEDIEREILARRLKHFRFNKRETAKSLGIGESTLYKKIKDFGLGPGK